MNIDRAVIEVNGGCNYSCSMCPQSSSKGRGKNWLKKMPISEFESYLDKIKPRIVNLDGSGEATLNNNLPEYIQACTDRGIESYIFSNGLKMNGKFMRDCIDAGLTYFRFSVIGYDPIIYQQWMKRNSFHTIVNNAADMIQYSNGRTIVASYHLILDQSREEFEIEQYRKNFIDLVGSKAEIWRQHNWAGSYHADKRRGIKRTCGRPFSPDIVVRAGGLDGKTGAVHPCCQVLGKDDQAVLGHLSESSVKEIFEGELYKELRQNHIDGNYPSYCKDCDFLIEDNKALAWSNSNRTIDHMTGTLFTLEDYNGIKSMAS